MVFIAHVYPKEQVAGSSKARKCQLTVNKAKKYSIDLLGLAS